MEFNRWVNRFICTSDIASASERANKGRGRVGLRAASGQTSIHDAIENAKHFNF